MVLVAVYGWNRTAAGLSSYENDLMMSIGSEFWVDSQG